MIRAFLFDIGNVLVRFDFSKAFREITALSEVQPDEARLAELERIKVRYEDGQLLRAAFFREVFEILKFRGTEEQFIAAWQGIFTPNAPMVSVVRDLHARYPLFLLSNTNCMHVEGLFRDFDYFALFRGATYSHVAGASKPMPRIFEIACRDHQLVPNTTLFIDDLAPNIVTAKELGFVTHHYDADRHDQFLDTLAKVGVNVAQSST